MVEPEVSVVIPTRGRRHLLAQTLGTVLRQGDIDIEVIVVDDASMDDTQDYLADLRDQRVRTVRHDRALGVSRARNTGVACARAPWVAFSDDDDLWAPDKLAAQLIAASGDASVVWVTSGAVDVDEELRITGGWTPPLAQKGTALLLRTNLVPGGGSATLVSREIIHRVGGFDEQLRITADWDLWIRVSQCGDMAAVQRPLVAYRMHGTNMSQSAAELLSELDVIEYKYRRLYAAWDVKIGRRDALTWQAHVSLHSHRPRKAALSYLRLVRMSPFGRQGITAAGLTAATVLAPRLVRIAGHSRVRRHMPERYKLEASTWLATLRTTGSTATELP